ncbi:Arachidonate 5-lipoxygenase [Exaiptasia diaphana]|nr:Arachidonate 5-lipoxygenase [Exaiptasia diaphana]
MSLHGITAYLTQTCAKVAQRKRGLDDKSKVPYFPYRDDGELIHTSIKNMLNEYVKLYYKHTCHVRFDPELQNFANEVSFEGKFKPDGGHGMHKMSFHFYADDTQIYIPFSCNDENALDAALNSIKACLCDIDLWMTINKLKLNKDKTEFLIFSSKHSLLSSSPVISFGSEIIHPSSCVRNIGVLFDSSLSLANHIKMTCKSSFYHLRNISRIRKFLSVKSTEILVHSFISSKLDNCNSLLYGLPKYLIDRLQAVQNACARLVMLSKKHDHITPLLINLHWLPVSARIKFKILLLTFKALHGLAPIYVQDMLKNYRPSRCLRSSSQLLLSSKSYNLKSYGYRSFSVAGPFLWNSLPSSIRDISSLDNFKTALKTFLFKQTYDL